MKPATEHVAGLDDPAGLVILDEWETVRGDLLRIIAEHGSRRFQRFDRIVWVDELPRNFCHALFGRLSDYLEDDLPAPADQEGDAE